MARLGHTKAVEFFSRLSSLVQPKEEAEDDVVARAEAETEMLRQRERSEQHDRDVIAAAERALALDQAHPRAQRHQTAGDL